MPSSDLLQILDRHSAPAILRTTAKPQFVSGDVPVYPFLAIVGQVEMKTALLLSAINPSVGGVLLIGPRGVAKTTAVRGVADTVAAMALRQRRIQFIRNCLRQAREEEAEIHAKCHEALDRGVVNVR
jgi:hypothetical protein